MWRMSALLDALYSVLVVVVAVAGLAFVFVATGNNGDESEDGGWSRWALALVVAAFLTIMVGGLVT